MNTADFKTKSLIKDWKMPKINGNNQFLNRVIVGIDGGYSSVKAITNSKIALFPSYAKKIDKKSFNIVAQLDDTTIIMTDNIKNETWVVGEMAETLIDDIDVSNTTDASLYSRYHLQNPIYIATMTAGLAICLMDMDLTNTQVYVQTGLPCEYLDDADELKEVLTGHYDVTIKIGNNEEKRVIFDLKKDAINVMEQPKGTMISAVYDNHGQPLADRIGILRQNTLIVDIGFGTEDLFSIKSSVNNKQNTYSDTAMKSVFEKFEQEKHVLGRLGGSDLCLLLEDKKQEEIEVLAQNFVNEVNEVNISWNKEFFIEVRYGWFVKEVGTISSTDECIRSAKMKMKVGAQMQTSAAKYAFEAMKEIRQNYQKEISVTYMAEQIGISRTHLSHCFKLIYQKSIQDYITSYRMEKAQELLIHTQKKIKEIAFLVGYKDELYFSKVFARLYGMSPSKFRKTMLT